MVTTEYYLRSIERLLIVSQNLCLAHSLEEITKIVLLAVRELTHSDGATFAILDNGFSYYVDENAITPVLKGQRFPVNLDISGWVMMNRKTRIIENILNEQQVYIHVYKHNFIESMTVVPICSEKPVGAIGAYWSNHHQGTTEELEILELLAKSTAVAVENLQVYSQLKRELSDHTIALEKANTLLQKEIQKSKAMEAEVRRLSLTDELTGLNNRRGFFLLAEQQLRLSKRSKIHTGVMFFELHRLADIKEQFGIGLAEDAVIELSRLLKRSFRNSDTLGRISEDEFVVLIQGYSLTVDVIEERVKTNVSEFNQAHHLPFSLIVNIGVKDYNYSSTISLENMITLAHANVYERQD
ncbi:diguanylate cyclase [Okeanomitos corallinicola TIOX110]|uniref:Diguanylate cyclase n=1 Tax=Okeanomitos corallinicola TIOX110 TaxID=3133117 RepID=A0ABZ2UUJ5_9CYAN